MLNYNIGADPELFLINKNKNKIISAIGIIPGEKHNTYKPETLPDGFGLQIDNILAEFNIPPITTEQELLENINIMKNYIQEYIARIDPALDIHCAASAIIDNDQLNHPNALLFGCDPDFNVYTRTINEKPTTVNPNLRSAGCHFHIGYLDPTLEHNFKIIQYLDTFLGIPSLMYDNDMFRRELYGKAGAFRMQPWGVEYRTLSGIFNPSLSVLLSKIAFLVSKSGFSISADNPHLKRVSKRSSNPSNSAGFLSQVIISCLPDWCKWLNI